MRKLFPGPLALAPAAAVSTDYERTGLDGPNFLPWYTVSP
jgi:hypothetical protein